MKWSDLGKKIADMAPMIGTALGGPAGACIGSIIAGVADTSIAFNLRYNSPRLASTFQYVGIY